jgi:hypothetical protein
VSEQDDPEVFYNEDTPTESGAFLAHIGTDLSGIITDGLFSVNNISVKTLTNKLS